VLVLHGDAYLDTNIFRSSDKFRKIKTETYASLEILINKHIKPKQAYEIGSPKLIRKSLPKHDAVYMMES
jgi:hypothetical protein